MSQLDKICNLLAEADRLAEIYGPNTFPGSFAGNVGTHIRSLRAQVQALAERIKELESHLDSERVISAGITSEAMARAKAERRVAALEKVYEAAFKHSCDIGSIYRCGICEVLDAAKEKP